MIRFPTGWFQVGWSDELQAGQVAPVKYFGRDLALMRSETGKPALFEAFCPHLGAHLGYGGSSSGDCIVCPFHGWEFDLNGNNVAIPYASKPNRAQRLKTWPVNEHSGLIFAWHDEDGLPPSWDPPTWPEADDPEFVSNSETRFIFPGVRCRPQWLVENAVDIAHQKYIHSSVDPGEFVTYDDSNPAWFQCVIRIKVNGRGRKTFLTSEPTEGLIETNTWGVGLMVIRFRAMDEALQLQSITPIDEDHSDLRTTMFLDIPGGISGPSLAPEHLARVRHIRRQVEKDLVIWEHMRYVDHAPFAGAETRPYTAFRRWSRRFYPDSPGDSTPIEISTPERV